MKSSNYRTCKICTKTKPKKQFYYGRSPCKECYIARTKAWSQAHPEKKKLYNKRYRELHAADITRKHQEKKLS